MKGTLTASMICPRCGKYTDDVYPNCVNCGFLLHPAKPDE